MLKPINKLLIEGFDDDYVLPYPAANTVTELLEQGVKEGWVIPIPEEPTARTVKETD